MAAAGPLSQLGRHAQALRSVQGARRMFARAGDRLRVARADSNIASLLFRQDRIVEALRVGRRAERTFARAGAVEDLAISRLNTAARLTSLHRFTAAERHYAGTRALCTRHGLALLLVEAEANLAYLLALRGDFARALALYAKVRWRAEQAGQRSLAITLMLDEAELLMELNAHARALPLLDGVLDRARSDGLSYEAAKARFWLAIVATREQRVDEALALFEQAYRGFADEGNQTRMALTALYRAVVLGRAGRLDDANALASSARATLVKSGLEVKAALADVLLARVCLARGGIAPASQYLASARRRLRRHPAPTLAYLVAFLSGAVAEARGRWAEAAAAYARAHRTLEGLRGQVGHEELKISFMDDKAIVYETMVRVALRAGTRAGSVARAFRFIEQGRSRVLAELMARGMPGGAPSATAAVRTARARLYACYRDIDCVETAVESYPAGRLVELRRRARVHEQTLSQALFDEARRDHRVADVQAGSVASLSDVQARLGAAVFAQYFEVRGDLHVLVADARHAAIVPLGPVQPIAQVARLALFNITQTRTIAAATQSRAAPDAIQEHLRSLWSQLIAPIDRWITPGRPLVVAAHGFLHRVPFQALLAPRGYLGADVPVAMTPSGTAPLGVDRTPRRGTGNLVLGLADTRTPRTCDEARAVAAELAPATLLLGRRATARALRTHGRRSRVVHIATHGFYRDENPMLSSIRLANTHVNVHDLYSLRLPAELITLSGCSTGASFVTGGDELVGLSRGLLAAGARCVHLSLWDVDDHSTTVYMQAFYRHYRAGASPAEAAQRAAAETRVQYPHPCHWAPFVVVGRAW